MIYVLAVWFGVALFVALCLAKYCAEIDEPDGLDSVVVYVALWPISVPAYWLYARICRKLHKPE